MPEIMALRGDQQDCYMCPMGAVAAVAIVIDGQPTTRIACLRHATQLVSRHRDDPPIDPATLHAPGQQTPATIPTPSPAPLPGADSRPQEPGPVTRSPTGGGAIAQRTAPRAIDGDTIEMMRPCGCVERIRLLGIDAPERGTKYAREAREALAEYLLDADVTLEADAAHEHRDRYGRLLAWAILSPHNRNASVLIAAEGLARSDTRFPPGRHGAEVRAAERSAIQARRGMWARDQPTEDPPRAAAPDPLPNDTGSPPPAPEHSAASTGR